MLNEFVVKNKKAFIFLLARQIGPYIPIIHKHNTNFYLARTNKLPSELRGKYYIVSGIKRTVKKEGATKGSTTWEINNAFEEQQPHNLE